MYSRQSYNSNILIIEHKIITESIQQKEPVHIEFIMILCKSNE